MNSSFDRLDMDNVFVAIKGNLDNFDVIMQGLVASDLEGYVFTMPVKEVALRYMDELSEEDKLIVSRARKIQRFLIQPFHVAEVFSSIPGAYVPVAETVRGFKEILEGKLDMVPEDAFFMRGGIDDVLKEAK